MSTLLKNGLVYTKDGFVKRDLFVSKNNVFFVSQNDVTNVIDCSNKIIVPGLVDVHVHFREPGFFYKETIKTGTMAAVRGGYTTVCTMPNLKPAPADYESLKVQLDIIKRDAMCTVVPYGTITTRQDGRSDVIDMDAIKDYVCAYSDDGKGMQTRESMKEAMLKAKKINKLIVAHCEDESLLHGGYIHEGRYAKEHGHIGICSESEWKQVERDIGIVRETGAGYHVCHVSTKESVDLIRKARKEGLNITCETAPHYLVLCEDDLQEEGRFKMNPPLRSREDKAALIEGIKDGTISIIATDHAPHSAEEKSKGLKGSPFGIVGLETSFPILYTHLVKKGIITLEKLLELMCINPAKRFNLEGGYISDGSIANLAIIDLNKEFKIDSNTFYSKGHATPFDGYTVNGEVCYTIYKGEIVYDKEHPFNR